MGNRNLRDCVTDLQRRGELIRIEQEVDPCLEAGEIQPSLAATYPLEQLREAQSAFIAKKHTGNIVVVP